MVEIISMESLRETFGNHCSDRILSRSNQNKEAGPTTWVLETCSSDRLSREPLPTRTCYRQQQVVGCSARRGAQGGLASQEGPSRQGPRSGEGTSRGGWPEAPGTGTHAGFSDHWFLEQNTYLCLRAFLLGGDGFPRAVFTRPRDHAGREQAAGQRAGGEEVRPHPVSPRDRHFLHRLIVEPHAGTKILLWFRADKSLNLLREQSDTEDGRGRSRGRRRPNPCAHQASAGTPCSRPASVREVTWPLGIPP